jgi:polyhydroxyalkanoate synthase
MHSPFVGGEQPSKRKILNAGDGAPLYFYASKHPQARSRPIVFLIPSLINRHYILDLRPEASMVNYINEQGFDCLMLEWPFPTAQDADKTTSDYVLLALEALQKNWNEINRPMVAIGYCMGGVITLALAQLFSRIQGMVLLATPWNYEQYPLSNLTLPQGKIIEDWVEESPLFSAEALQMLLYIASPYRLYQRFSRFAQETREEVIASFVALEHWANDGVPVTRAVAKECLIDWPRDNILMKGQWDISGEKIDPTALSIPALLAIPIQDHIVPSSVSEPLAAILPNTEVIKPLAGHVGMIAGMQRMKLWEPMGEWLLRHFGA